MIDPTSLTDAMTASGGRWRVTPDRHYGPAFAVVDEAGLLVLDGRSHPEAHAIVRVRNAVPDLLDKIKRLPDIIQQAKEDAWDEALQAHAAWAQNQRYYVEDEVPNPYRADEIEAGR